MKSTLQMLKKPLSLVRRRQNRRKNLVYIPLIFFALVALLPFYYLIITAMKSLNEASTQATMFPHSFELIENIRFVLNFPKYDVVNMFLRTMFVFALKALGTGITCSLVGYGFAMFRFPHKNIIFMVLLATVMIPGELLSIPIYEFMVNNGLKEAAYFPLWIATWFATDVFMIFLFKQFFQTIPIGLIEAARIDGYSEFRIFWKIAVPLNKPVFVTVILLYFIGTYNDLYGPALYGVEGQELMVNSISMFENLIPAGSSSSITPWNYVAVASLIAMIPEIFLFGFMQKQFMESVSGVGIKG